MNLKRSDIMRRLLDDSQEHDPEAEALIAKLDQLDDPAFWAWWTGAERERHMKMHGWTSTMHGWYGPSHNKGHGLSAERAWQLFRVEHGNATSMPMQPIMLAFDPSKIDGLSDIFQNPTAWTLWLLWKSRHIVSQHFNNEVRAVSAIIDRQKPKTPAELKCCFPGVSRFDFSASIDIERFCEEAVPYFTGEKEVDFVINPPPANHP